MKQSDEPPKNDVKFLTLLPNEAEAMQKAAKEIMLKTVNVYSEYRIISTGEILLEYFDYNN